MKQHTRLVCNGCVYEAVAIIAEVNIGMMERAYSSKIDAHRRAGIHLVGEASDSIDRAHEGDVCRRKP